MVSERVVIAGLICLTFILGACEQPGAPDFSLKNKIETPLVAERTYKFLGDKNALIDTTNDNMDSLFSVDEGGLVRLSKRLDINSKEHHDIFPEFRVERTSIGAEVGELNLGTFSSGSEPITKIRFEDILGENPGVVTEGTPIPDQTDRRISDISYSSDYFKSATIKEGSLVITIENQLGFDIDELNVEVISMGNSLGKVQFPDGPGLLYTEEKDGELPVAGERLEELEFVITFSWSDKVMKTDDPGPISINKMGGKNIIASEVEAYIPAHTFSISGTVMAEEEENPYFKFTKPGHYIELESGVLLIHNIENDIDLDLDTLQISFPDIRREPYTPSDSLVITFAGKSKISAGTNNPLDKEISLSDLRIYAEGQSLDYHIYAVSNNNKEGEHGTIRAIHESDNVSANIGLETLRIRKIYGTVTPRDLVINNDSPNNGNGNIDLFNDEEAEVVRFDDIVSWSERIDGLELVDPGLDILYATNLGVKTTVYAAIAGIRADGNTEFLSGRPGSDYYVDPTEVPAGLMANGQALTEDELIKFDLDISPDGSPIRGINSLDKEKTNVDKFISNLPSEIRFIGLASLNNNPDDPDGILVNPLQFGPGIGIGLPLHLSVDNSTFSDTVKANLKSLTKEEDQHFISEATFRIGYVNKLPFRMELNLIILDEEFEPVTEVPLPTQDPAYIGGAQVDPGTHFVESGRKGTVVLELTSEQLDKLNSTRHIIIRISFNSTNGEEVKVRAEDTVSLSLELSVSIDSDIN